MKISYKALYNTIKKSNKIGIIQQQSLLTQKSVAFSNSKNRKLKFHSNLVIRPNPHFPIEK